MSFKTDRDILLTADGLGIDKKREALERVILQDRKDRACHGLRFYPITVPWPVGACIDLEV